MRNNEAAGELGALHSGAVSPFAWQAEGGAVGLFGYPDTMAGLSGPAERKAKMAAHRARAAARAAAGRKPIRKPKPPAATTTAPAAVPVRPGGPQFPAAARPAGPIVAVAAGQMMHPSGRPLTAHELRVIRNRGGLTQATLNSAAVPRQGPRALNPGAVQVPGSAAPNAVAAPAPMLPAAPDAAVWDTQVIDPGFTADVLGPGESDGWGSFSENYSGGAVDESYVDDYGAAAEPAWSDADFTPSGTDDGGYVDEYSADPGYGAAELWDAQIPDDFGAGEPSGWAGDGGGWWADDAMYGLGGGFFSKIGKVFKKALPILGTVASIAIPAAAPVILPAVGAIAGALEKSPKVESFAPVNTPTGPAILAELKDIGKAVFDGLGRVIAREVGGKLEAIVPQQVIPVPAGSMHPSGRPFSAHELRVIAKKGGLSAASLFSNAAPKQGARSATPGAPALMPGQTRAAAGGAGGSFLPIALAAGAFLLSGKGR